VNPQVYLVVNGCLPDEQGFDQFTEDFLFLLFQNIRYGDGAANATEENSSIFSLIRMH